MGRPRKETGQVIINKPKREHPLISAFDDTFWVFPWNGGYCLYDRKRECKRANAQYVGQFYISTNGNRYVFRDEYYDNIDSLIEAMDKYNATLPFSPEIYDPTNRKNYMIEMAASDYLTSIGFKSTNDYVHFRRYSLSDVFGHMLCIIDVKTEFNTSKGLVRRNIISSDKQEMWQEAPFNDLDSCIAAINSIVASYLSVVQAQLMNSLKSLTQSRAVLFFTQTFDVGSFSVYTEDAKQQTIAYLESELKRLKGE